MSIMSEKRIPSHFVILSALNDNHNTIRDIIKYLEEREIALSISSVYKILGKLKRKGVVEVVTSIQSTDTNHYYLK